MYAIRSYYDIDPILPESLLLGKTSYLFSSAVEREDGTAGTDGNHQGLNGIENLLVEVALETKTFCRFLGHQRHRHIFDDWGNKLVVKVADTSLRGTVQGYKAIIPGGIAYWPGQAVMFPQSGQAVV